MSSKPKIGKYIPSLNATEAFVRSGASYENRPVSGAVSGATVVVNADSVMDFEPGFDIDKAIEKIQKR